MKTRHNLPIMSVKELAAELGQPQTKLYRHVRQLEAVGLIKVASTRMVSGILEQRYQACQQDLTFGRGFLVEHVDESAAALQTALDLYRAFPKLGITSRAQLRSVLEPRPPGQT